VRAGVRGCARARRVCAGVRGACVRVSHRAGATGVALAALWMPPSGRLQPPKYVGQAQSMDDGRAGAPSPLKLGAWD